MKPAQSLKTVVCYGDSNVWGFVPGSFNTQTQQPQRFNLQDRWTGHLQAQLGASYHIVNLGRNGRTTHLNDPTGTSPPLNGRTTLRLCLKAYPSLDCILFWLGTNDTKIHYQRTCTQITNAMASLIHDVKATYTPSIKKCPKIILVAPMPIRKVPPLNAYMDSTSVITSQHLGKTYQRLAQKENCLFLDAGRYVRASHLDGVHLSKGAHNKLGKVFAHFFKEHLTNF